MAQPLPLSFSVFGAVLLMTSLTSCRQQSGSAETVLPIAAIGYFAGCGIWGCTEIRITAEGKACVAAYSPGKKPEVEITSGTVSKDAFLKIVRLYQSSPPNNVRGL